MEGGAEEGGVVVRGHGRLRGVVAEYGRQGLVGGRGEGTGGKQEDVAELNGCRESLDSIGFGS